MFDRLKRLFGGKKKTSEAHATHTTSKGARKAVRRSSQKHPNRDTSAAYSPLATAEFLQGIEVTTLTSDWVRSAQWDEMAGILTVVFEDERTRKQHTHYYPCDISEAQAWARAPSKGGFIHDYFIANGIKGSS